MIAEGCDDSAIQQQAVEDGMRTLYQSAVEEVLNGTTVLSEIMRVVDIGNK